jgi:hypothetical protein
VTARVLRGVWDFVVGDDWRAALGVALALAATALLESGGLSAWWVSPLAAIAILFSSVRRAAVAQRKAPGAQAVALLARRRRIRR